MTHVTESTGHSGQSGSELCFGLSGEREQFYSPALWDEAQRLLPMAGSEQLARVADAVSLRGADLIETLIDHFQDVDEALAALDDYAGAFDDLADFGRSVAEARCPSPDLLAQWPEAAFTALSGALICEGRVWPIRVGDDLHLFWSV